MSRPRLRARLVRCCHACHGMRRRRRSVGASPSSSCPCRDGEPGLSRAARRRPRGSPAAPAPPAPDRWRAVRHRVASGNTIVSARELVMMLNIIYLIISFSYFAICLGRRVADGARATPPRSMPSRFHWGGGDPGSAPSADVAPADEPLGGVATAGRPQPGECAPNVKFNVRADDSR